MKKTVFKYSAAFAFCTLTGWIYTRTHGFGQAAPTDKYRILCDACALPGLLLILSGALLWTVSRGSLDALGFLCGRQKESYGNYVARRRAKPPKNTAFLYMVGGICMAISLVFLALYCSTA